MATRTATARMKTPHPLLKRLEKKTFWSLDKAACLTAVLKAYEEEGRIGQTVRHYYYKLLSAGVLRPLPEYEHSARNAYNFVSTLLTDARREQVIPWNAVVDPGRRALTHWAYRSLAEYIRYESVSGYVTDIWRGQPRRLEVWVEKDGIAEFVNGVVGDYRVPVYVAKGYASATVIKDAADRYGNGRGWTLLYGGDFDPSGLDIERSLYETLRVHGARPQIHRVALTQADTVQLPNEAALDLKDKDKRYKQFVATYGEGQKGYELEAMPATQLQQKLLDALALYMDSDEFTNAMMLERAIRQEAGTALRAALAGLGNEVLRNGLPETPLDMETVRRYLTAPNGSEDEDE